MEEEIKNITFSVDEKDILQEIKNNKVEEELDKAMIEVKEELKEEEEPEPLPPIAYSDEVLENKSKYDFNTYIFHALPIPVKLRQSLHDEIMEEYTKVKSKKKSERKYSNGKIIL